MGNCVYYVGPPAQQSAQNGELQGPTQALYDSRELAMERMQAEAEALQRRGHRRRAGRRDEPHLGPDGARVQRRRHRRRRDPRRPPDPAPGAGPHGERLTHARATHRHGDEPRRAWRKGGIPLRAEERLAEEAGPHSKLFTSDLSVNEFVLARDAGCEPIAQLMGSSIYHVGQIPDYKGKTDEITVISDAHRESRQRALSRLWQEAVLVGADAVIGAHLRDRMITMGARGKGGDDGGEVLEFTVVGTAVRAPWLTHPPGQPIVTDLSGQDLWALVQDGWEPCGFFFDFCKYHGWHVTSGAERRRRGDDGERGGGDGAQARRPPPPRRRRRRRRRSSSWGATSR